VVAPSPDSRPLSRRHFLRAGSAAAAGLILGGTTGGCVATAGMGGIAPVPPGDPGRRLRPLAPVRVSPGRVARTVAGLRPFRPGGFVVRSDRFGDRVVVHNYGHGGGGISLAWGSSELAAELVSEAAAERGFREVAVLGSGIMGLTSARLLQDRGFQVTVHARELPPFTTSNAGGGQWSPFTVFEGGATSPAFDAQYERAARISHARYQLLVGQRYGVRWMENLVLRGAPTGERRGSFADLFLDEEEYGPGEHPFPAPWLGRSVTLLIEPGIFLSELTRDILLRGGRIVPRAFSDLEEVLALETGCVVNCTGLGSRALFGDETLVPIRGQLALLLPQPEVDYMLLGGGAYMFPRSDGIVLGGSQERGVWTPETTPGVIEGILDRNRAHFRWADPPGVEAPDASGSPSG
jgi:D-amino-acid oxidase